MIVQVPPRPGRLVIVPGIALLLCVLLMAAGQQQQVHATPAAPAARAAAIDCNNPLPGQWARLIGDDEIMVAYREADDPRWMHTATVNDANNILQAPLTHELQDIDKELYEDHSTKAASADLDGNHKAELILGIKNRDSDIGALTDPFDGATYTDYTEYPNWSDTDDRNNGDIKDVDVAAGRVNPADANQKLVLAYRDDAADIHIKVLNGKSGGYIANADDTEAADMYWDQNERGDVHHSAVATGDMNGDGVDEIVVAFKDSGSDLQVMVVPYVSGASHNPTPLYEYDSFTATPKYDTIADDCSSYSNKRPLDIAMGDIDGDSQDEIVVAFRGANCKYGRIELMAFDYEGTEAGKYTLSHTNFLEFEPELDLNYQYEAANNISVAVGDLDGDGTDEIAMAWNLIANQEHEDRDLYHFVSTFEYYKKDSRDWAQHCNKTGPSCLGLRPGAWHPGKHNEGTGANEVNHESWAEVATGDLDQDGNAEVVLGRYNTSTGDVEVYAFNAESGISSPYGKQSIAGDSIWDMALAVGDADGDSRWGQYYNKQCEARHEVVVNGFVHTPPFWPTGPYANSHRTAASYGMEIGGGKGSGVSVENSVGASVEIGGEAGGFNIKEEELEVPGIKGSFTREWKRSIKSETESATTNVVGTGVETLPPYDAGTNTPTFEGVSTVETTQWCYDYYEQRLGVMTVCTPRPEKTIYDRTIEWWYADGPEEYPNSWVPLGMNLAQGRSATQSSTYTNEGPHGEAWRAVDGNTNGDYYAGSVSATNSEPSAWWQVDLGGLQWIDAVDIWKMTNTCSDCATRLQKFWVFVTEASSFASNDPNVLKNDSTVWSHYYDPVATNPTLIHVGEYGRVVRIQLAGSNYLNLAEVQVYGMPGDPTQWPTDQPEGTIASSNPFTLTWPGARQQAVNGTLYEVWPADYALGIAPGTDDIPFTMGTNMDQRDVTASGTEDTWKLGLEIRNKGEVSRSYSEEESNIATWEASVTFEGVATGIEDTKAPKDLTYGFHPYVWLEEVKSVAGVSQKFLVLDYWVSRDTAAPAPPEVDVAPQAVPAAPLITSPTHPDPGTWYANSTATFTWTQPEGDPAIKTYDWRLDQKPDTVPTGVHRGPAATKTYQNLADGAWTMHVRAMNAEGEWGETGHRTIQVDAHAPQVSLAVTPKWPDGDGGWYVSPVTVAVAADDGAGSGVATLEISTDGVSWQPYITALQFTANTPGATLYARARDAVGNVSQPVSTTFKIDRTAPNSHVTGGAGPGAWVAEVGANAAGNEELVLAGAITDALSGRHGIDLKVDGLDWTGPTEIGSWHPFADRPQIEVNWYYTATAQIGAGYHIFTGQAFDAAGNREPEYEIARVLWLPQDAPELKGSSVAAVPSVARPGAEVLLTLVGRNAGFQEAHVAMSDTLPAGLEPVLDLLPSDAVYDAATRTVTWPAKLLWPGQWVRWSFLARVDAGTRLWTAGAAQLENRATFHAFWPNTDLLPPADRQKFLDKEQTVVTTATLTVNPNLPLGADVIPPLAILAQPMYQQVHGPDVALRMSATADTRRMYIREWSPDPITGDWTVRQNSGWIDYRSPYTWTLSSGQGVKYVGVWLQDAGGNVANLDEHTMMFINRMDARQVLAAGERVQYRGILTGPEWMSGHLTTLAGDPDVYIWGPRNDGLPDFQATATVLPGQSEMFSRQFGLEPGRYLMDVQGVGASEYEVAMSSPYEPSVSAAGVAAVKPRPAHPLTVADPLSAGQLGPDVTLGNKRYLPVIFRSN